MRATDNQTPENQIRQLRKVASRHGWTVVAQYVDHAVSGAKRRDQRPQHDELLRGVTRKEFDMIAAWSVDRLGRSLQDLLGFLMELEGKTLGRPRVAAKVDSRMRAFLAAGMGKVKIGRTLGVATSVVQRVAQEQRAGAVRAQL